MYIVINKTKFPIVEAKGFFNKFKGLMLKNNITYILKLRCNGIHTFFMRENIDVILTDKHNNILHILPNLKKRRIVLPKKNVYFTYELPENTINNANITDIIIKDE